MGLYSSQGTTLKSAILLMIGKVHLSSYENDFIEAMESSEVGVTNEISTSSTYRFSFNEGGTTSTLRFESVSSTTLTYYVTNAGVTTGPILLTKE